MAHNNKHMRHVWAEAEEAEAVTGHGPDDRWWGTRRQQEHVVAELSRAKAISFCCVDVVQVPQRASAAAEAACFEVIYF